jgi:hypothetical protein
LKLSKTLSKKWYGRYQKIRDIDEFGNEITRRRDN